MDYSLREDEDASAVQEAVRQGIRSADPPDVGRRDWGFAELGGFPPGHTHFHLRKELVPPTIGGTGD